jgi:hypothetical protein
MSTELEIATTNLRGSCVTVEKQLHMLFRVSGKPSSGSEARGLADSALWDRIVRPAGSTDNV